MAMNAHGDKSAEQSISNALAAMKKAGRIIQEGKSYKVPDGRPAPVANPWTKKNPFMSMWLSRTDPGDPGPGFVADVKWDLARWRMSGRTLHRARP